MAYTDVLKRALLAGLIAGILGAVYLIFVTEPIIDEAIGFEIRGAEGDAAKSAGAAAQEQLFNRHEQVAGGAVAVVMFSLFTAVVFGNAYAVVRHGAPGRSELSKSLWLSLVAFGTVSVLPGIKYPAAPPGAGEEATVGIRTLQWITLTVIGVALAWALARLSSALRQSMDDGPRIAAVTATGIVAYGLLMIVSPNTPAETPPEVPSALVWEFRVASLGGLALMWLTLGLGTGSLLDRQLRAKRPTGPSSRPS